jgi:recombination protein RecA
VKNKIAPPFKKVEFDMLFASGISYEGDVLDLGELNGVLERSGGWYSYKGEKIDNGREKCRAVLKSKPSLAHKIENDIRAKLGVDPRPASVAKPVAPSAVEKPAEAPKPAAKHEDDKKPAKK